MKRRRATSLRRKLIKTMGAARIRKRLRLRLRPAFAISAVKIGPQIVQGPAVRQWRVGLEGENRTDRSSSRKAVSSSCDISARVGFGVHDFEQENAI